VLNSQRESELLELTRRAVYSINPLFLKTNILKAFLFLIL